MIGRAVSRIVPVPTGSVAIASAVAPTEPVEAVVTLRGLVALSDFVNRALADGVVPEATERRAISALRDALGFDTSRPDPVGSLLASLGLDPSCPFDADPADMGAHSPWPTANDVAQDLEMTEHSVRRLVRDGSLRKHPEETRPMRIDPASVDEWKAKR